MHLLCPHCHNPIELDRLESGEVACPGCGSSFRVDGGSTADLGRTRLGKFELLSAVGSGAFGTVYKARDPELDRTVAIKVPRAGNLPDGDDLGRFLREARSVAQLRHPAIVPIYEVGYSEGLPYLVSEFVEGVTLADLLSARRPPPHEAAKLAAAIAEALQYAHDQGVVHRDVKPSNVMLDADGNPHVTDFGLAKREAGEITMTVEGQVLGTPAYMSPEQARGEGHKVDGRSDVYSVGVILYQLLTGELPFRGTTRMLLHQVLHDDPRPPRRLNDRIPRDLETVCLKAMAKDPSRRYQTAAHLAEDLGRLLRGESIKARPVSGWERGWVWAKRRPAQAALLVVSGLAAVLVAGGAVGLGYHGQLQEEYGKTQAALEEVRQAQKREEVYQYYHHIALAHTGWQANDLVQMGPLLEDCPAERRGWEWHYLQRLRHGELHTTSLHPSMVISVAFSPDGTLLATSGTRGMVKVLDAATGLERLTLKGHPDDSEVWSVAFSPDGTRLASAGSDLQIKVWDLKSGSESLVIRGHEARICSVAFNADGSLLISSSNDRTVRVWEAGTGRLVHRLEGHRMYACSAAFSPDGALVASSGYDKEVKLWDAATGREVRALPGHRAAVDCVAFSPDGTRLATASQDRTIIVWDLRAGRIQHTLTGHTGLVRSVAFCPTGGRLASASTDQTIRLWDLTTGRELLTHKGHSSEVLGVTFSPDGTRLASGSPDGTVKTWDTTTNQEAHALRGHANEVQAVACSPDGHWIASASHDQTVMLWDVVTRQEARTLRGHEDHVTGVAFSPDGQFLASASADRTVRLWDAATGREVRAMRGHGDVVMGVAYSPDGKKLATASWDRTVGLWEPASGRKLLTMEGHTLEAWGVAFRPGGERLASASVDSTVRVWDGANPQALQTMTGHQSGVMGVAYSPDGAWLATGSEDNTMKIWDTAAGRELHTLANHSGTVNAVAFSPDGRRLASASADSTVRIWDTGTWREALALRGHTGAVFSVAFGHDGTRIVSAGSDGVVRVWDGRPLTPEADTEREALGLLESLFARPLGKADVVAYLRRSPTVRPRARQTALALLEQFREETEPDKYHAAAWPVIRHRFANQAANQFALAQVSTARERAPDQPRYRLALGISKYRLGKFHKGHYEEALDTLARCDQEHPTTLAFLAMTRQQLGLNDQARATLARLREVMKNGQWAEEPDVKEFLAEAELLIEGKPGRPKL